MFQNQPGASAPGTPYRPIYKRWWFWVVVLILTALAWYLRGYFAWQGEQGKYDIQNLLSQNYWNYLERQSVALEQQYREDPYGGATPEETLKSLVSALQKEDIELASNYYIPEQRSQAKNDLQESKDKGHLATYLSILQGVRKGVAFADKETYEIQFFNSAGSQIHVEQFKLNPFTQKWLISDL